VIDAVMFQPVTFIQLDFVLDVAATTTLRPLSGTDLQEYEFWLNGERVRRDVVRAFPEEGWIEIVFDDRTRRIRGSVEAVHRQTGVVRRTELR
jgi:hypothetical protein